MANQGPFSQQFEQPYQAPRNPAAEAGMGGGLSAIAHVATNFLEGMAQGRLANQQRQEMQRQRNISALTALMQQAEQSDLTPAAKQQFSATMMQRLAHEVAGASSGDKKADSSNPVVSWAKNVASSIVGPNPGKVAPIDDAFLGQAYNTLLSGPTMAKVNADALAEIQEARKEIMNSSPWGVSEADLMNHPRIMNALSMMEQAGMRERISPTLQLALSGLTPAQSMEARDQYLFGQFADSLGGMKGRAQPSVVTQTVPNPESQSGPFAGNLIMQQFAPGSNGSAGGAASAVAPQTIAGQPQTPDGQRLPFEVDGVSLQGGHMAMLGRRKDGHEKFIIDKTNGQQIPMMEYSGLPGWGFGSNGKVYDLSRVSTDRYDIAKTAPVSKEEATDDQLKAVEAAIRARIGMEPRIKPDAYDAFITSAWKMPRSERLKAMNAIIPRVDTDVDYWRNADQKNRELKVRQGNTEESRKTREETKKLSQAMQVEGLKNRWAGDIRQARQYINMNDMNGIVGQIETAMADLAANPKDTAALGNIDRQIAYAKSKASDMGSTVREGELKLWQDVGGLIQNLRAKTSGFFSGDGRLFVEETRKKLYDLLRQSRDNYKRDVYLDVIKPTWKRAREFGKQNNIAVDMEGIVPGNYQGMALADPDFKEAGGGKSGGSMNVDPFGGSGFTKF